MYHRGEEIPAREAAAPAGLIRSQLNREREMRIVPLLFAEFPWRVGSDQEMSRSVPFDAAAS